MGFVPIEYDPRTEKSGYRITATRWHRCRWSSVSFQRSGRAATMMPSSSA